MLATSSLNRAARSKYTECPAAGTRTARPFGASAANAGPAAAGKTQSSSPVMKSSGIGSSRRCRHVRDLLVEVRERRLLARHALAGRGMDAELAELRQFFRRTAHPIGDFRVIQPAVI